MFLALAISAAALSTVAAALVPPTGRTVALPDTMARRRDESRALRYGWSGLCAGLGL